MKLLEKILSFKKKLGYEQKTEWDKIAFSYMNGCKNILDVGCGEGRFLGQDPERIVGIDHNEKSIQICKKKKFKAFVGNVLRMDSIPDESFDAVHCSHVIEHFSPSDAYKLIKEIDRIVREGGIVCLRTPLMHRGFYWDFTHVKPYYPEAVLHYLRIKRTNQRTLDEICSSYKIIKLKYRKEFLFRFLLKTPFRVISTALYRSGITSWKKNGYMLVLKKIRSHK